MTPETAEKNRARAKAWYYANKERALKRLRITNKAWALNNKQAKRKISYAYSCRHPWVLAYRRIVNRCNPKCGNKFYINKGIKALIGVKELRELWIRDRADLMNRPSIDRIDRNGNYTKENCQFIELSENLKRRVFKRKSHAFYEGIK